MAVTTEDVAEWVKVQWAANASLIAKVPVASLILGRVPDGQLSPYATFEVKDGAAQRFATGYLQTFDVTVKVYDQAGGADAGTIKVLVEAALKLDGTNAGQTVTLPNGRSLRVLGSNKGPGGLDEDPATQQGQAVKYTTDRFEVLAQS